MTGAAFKEALKGDDPLIGTLLVSTSPFWPKALAAVDLDFVFIDTEHIAINRETLSWMCRCYAAMGLPPLVRIPDQDPNAITVALDDGASAVVAPYIENADQVRALVGASKFRPLKGDRLAKALAGHPLEPGLQHYVTQNCQSNTLLINIESTPALENLERLIDVDGVDGILIGPHDLSCSLGIPEQYDHPLFLRSVETVFKKTRSRGLAAGIHFWGPLEEQKRLIQLGASFLIHKADIIMVKEQLQSDLAALRPPRNNPQPTNLNL